MLSRLKRDERGMALMMALMTMTVLTIVAGTTIFYTTQSQHSSQLGLSRDDAYRLAEAGINNAMAVLGQPPDAVTGIGNNALDPNVFCGLSGETYASGCTIKTTYPSGYVTWGGTLNTGTATWTITATGYARNTDLKSATGNSMRTLSASVYVYPTLTQPLNTPVWNYIYATKPASTPPTCDEDLSNSVTISSPFYVEGNLCLHNTAHITKGPLVVKGRLEMDSQQGGSNYAGTLSVPLSDAHIANGCSVKNRATDVPCVNGTSANGGPDNLYATVLDTTPPGGLSPPTPNWNNWYLNANPGPYFPCQTINGQAPLNPLTFDNPVDPNVSDTDAQKLAYKNDNLGLPTGTPQNLTPSTDYRCQTSAGELSWSASTHTLTIKGTIFIDGDLYINNGAVNLYKGQGVIYLGGTLLIKNSSLCGAIYNGACDMRTYQASPVQGWDPNTNLICFVANATGGQDSTGDSIQVVSGNLQGAAYATGNVEADTKSNIDGPIVGYQVILGQSVQTSFPSITIVPEGMPSNPTAYAQVNPPSGYSG